MDIISFNEAATANGRIKKFIKDPDSDSGIVTVPKVIGAGESVTIPAGRVAVLPNVQVDGTLNIEGEVFIPSGSTFGDLENQIATKADTSYVNGKYSGFKNYIINGSFDIWQRGTSNVFNSSLPSGMTADRWACTQQFTTGALTVAKSSLVYNGTTYISQKVTATQAVVISGTAQYMPFYYKVEGYNAFNLNGKSFTISFIFNTNIAGTYPITFTTSSDGSSGNNIYVTTFSAISGVQKITITVPSCNTIGYTNGYGIRIIIGSVASSGYNTTSTMNTWITNSNNITHLEGAFNWAGTVGNYIEVTQIQLEEGTVRTPFENRPYGLELSLCQRYYQIVKLGLYNNTGITTVLGGSITFPTKMRVTPSMGLLNGVPVTYQNLTLEGTEYYSTVTTGLWNQGKHYVSAEL